MIFSTDLCPLCNNKLELNVLTSNCGELSFIYYCDKKEMIRDASDMVAIMQFHYENRCFKTGELATMIMCGYQLEHSKIHERTAVYRAPSSESKKIIFVSGLLDLDYTKPHTVINKLKLLATFS